MTYKIRKYGAGGENRTLVLSLENLYTSRCTTPAVAPLYQYLYLLASPQDLIYRRNQICQYGV